MKIQIDATGTSALLFHNPQLVDPQCEFTRRLKELTGKRKKTDADIREMERVEWYGGLFVNDGRVVFPAAKLRKCLIEAGKIRKYGTALARALVLIDLFVPVKYDGPQEIDALAADARFASRLSVGVNGRRVMRIRPQFPDWRVSVRYAFLPNVGVSLADLDQIARDAGELIGVGDNRVNGYGRFTATVKEIA